MVPPCERSYAERWKRVTNSPWRIFVSESRLDVDREMISDDVVSVSPDSRSVPAVLHPSRLAAVRATELLDTPAEDAFDRLSGLARTLLNAPFAFVTIVDETRSFWKSCLGVDAVDLVDRQNPVEESFCQYVINTDRPLIVNDARLNPMTSSNPSIEKMGVLAWAGFPVRSIAGDVLGTFCVVDTVTREWTDDEVTTLEALAGAVEGEIRLRTLLERRSAEIDATQREMLFRERLVSLAEGLAGADTTTAVAAVIAELGVQVFGATVATIGIADHARRNIHVRGTDVTHAVVGDRYETVPLNANLPITNAVVNGELSFLASRDEVLAKYPHIVADADLMGLEALASIPLYHSNGTTLGALTVGWMTPMMLDSNVHTILRTVAVMSAQAIERAQLGDTRRELVATLQRELLPAVPTITGLEIAVRYVPATSGLGFGGDWYDFIELDDGRVIVVVGDIAGHGIQAAARMAQVRGAINALARLNPDDPATMLSECERMLRHLDEAYIATLVIFTVDPLVGVVTYMSAGHPSAVLVHADGAAERLEGGRRSLLGSGTTTAPPRAMVAMPEGSTLIAFTDGLVERRDQSADAGTDLIIASAVKHPGFDPETLASRIVEDLIGENSVTDDVALVVIRRRAM